jgi:hypothetical protein
MKFAIVLIITFCLVITLAPVCGVSAYQDLFGGIETEKTFSDDDTAAGYLVKPYLDHYFEYDIGENVRLILSSGGHFEIHKFKADDEAGNVFHLYTEPEAEVTFSELLSLDELIGVYFDNAKVEGDRENTYTIETTTELSFGNLEEDVAGFSRWEEFDQGFAINGSYWRQLYSKQGDEKADEVDHTVGVEAKYAYFNPDAAFMVEPTVTVTKHLNDQVDESLNTELNLRVAKDFNTVFTVESETILAMTKPDSDADTEKELGLNVNLIVNKIPKLEITFNGHYTKNMSDDEADPVFGVGLKGEYEIFIKEDAAEE